MENPESIKQIIQKLSKTRDGAVIEATVISADPLKVRATNDDKLILSMATLVVPRHLTDYTTKATISVGEGILDSTTKNDGTHTHSGGDHSHDGGAHTHIQETFTLTKGTITVHNALKVGEIVYLMPFNDGKKYYILDRRG